MTRVIQWFRDLGTSLCLIVETSELTKKRDRLVEQIELHEEVLAGLKQQADHAMGIGRGL